MFPGELQAVLLRYTISALVAILFGATCFVKGCEYQQGRDAVKETEVLVRKEEIRTEVTVGQEKIAAAYRAGMAAGEDKFRTQQMELNQTKGERDAKPAVCDLSEHDLRLLNSTRVPRRPATDTGGPATGVSGAGGIAEWASRLTGPSSATGRGGPVEVSRPPEGAR